MRRSLILTGVIALLGAGGCGGSDSPSEDDAKATAEDYLEAASEGDFDTCTELASESVNNEDVCGIGSPSTRIDFPVAQAVDIEGDSAEVQVDTGGNYAPIVVGLDDEGGEWKVTRWRSER